MKSDALNSFVADVVSGSHSRRDLMKKAAALGIGAAAAGTFIAHVESASAAGQLEVFSWWTSEGEHPALVALFDNFKKSNPDVEIIDAGVAGGGGGPAQAVLQTRLQGNQPPDSWQSHPGRELMDQYVAVGYCLPMTDLYESEGWNAAIPQGLIDQVTKDGEKYLIPVGVHRGNGLWYNKKVVSDAGITMGDTMTQADFMTALETLKTAGVTGLAFGDKDSFVPAQTFENHLLGALGPEKYSALFGGTEAWNTDEVKAVVTSFGELLNYVNSDHSALAWSDATALIIEGKAAFNTMGDWAYGEFVAKNVVDQMGWVSYPGSDGSFVLVVDGFTLPKGAPHADNAVAWLKSVGTIDAQAAFNPLKGSIPARTDVPMDGFSDYHKWSAASFAKDALVPSAAHGLATSPAFKQAFYDAAIAFVTDKDADTFTSTLQDAQDAEK
ncbi:MAG TPA: ABC transporter substrate-binding protein [Thermomicrobiales bacterium]|nr:ABC transporter substrate-binding protein [Thermomicrobiales bacterium]